MARWINPVYDRTQADVDYAKLKIAQWASGYFPNDSTFVMDLKGSLNASDLNRIEGNMQYVYERYIIAGMIVPINIKTNWESSDIPVVSDILRIVNNLSALVNAFVLHPHAPEIPASISTYVDANAIEEHLFLLKQMLDLRELSLQKSGMFFCGSRRILPISTRENDKKLSVKKLGTFKSGADIFLPIEGSELDVV